MFNCIYHMYKLKGNRLCNVIIFLTKQKINLQINPNRQMWNDTNVKVNVNLWNKEFIDQSETYLFSYYAMIAIIGWYKIFMKGKGSGDIKTAHCSIFACQFMHKKSNTWVTLTWWRYAVQKVKFEVILSLLAINQDCRKILNPD